MSYSHSANNSDDSLLEALVSPVADQRRRAEAHWLALSPSDRLGTLLASSLVPLAPILLRREILKLTDTVQIQQVLTSLMDKISTSVVQQQQEHYHYCLAEIAGVLTWLDKSASVQVVTTLLSQHPNEVSLWTAVAERAPEAFASSGAWHQRPPLHGTSGLLYLVVAAKAIDSSPGKEPFEIDPRNPACTLQEAIPQILTTVDVNDDRTWELLVQAAEDVPVLLQGPALEAVATFCSNSNSLMAVQVVVLLLDCKLAVEPSVLNHALKTCWNVMLDLDEDEREWAAEAVPVHEKGAVDDDDDTEFAQALLQCLLRAGALPTLLPAIEHAFNEQSHLSTRAALAALECAVTVVPHQLGPHIPGAIRAAIASISSPSCRVQYQAVRLLGVLCETTEQVSTDMLEPMVRATHSLCSKVAAIACQAVTAYCRASGEDAATTVVPYLKSTLEVLASGPLSGNDIGVKIRAVGAVANLAQVTGVAFAGFYSQIMPGLLQLVGQTGSFAAQQLAGSSLEAATIVGQALGEDNAHVFVDDAHRIMQQAVFILQQQRQSTIPMDQLLAACARIATVLGEAYLPYVEVVLPRLLELAADPADVEVSEGDLASLGSTKSHGIEMADDGTESMTVVIPGRGLTKVTINTTKIQEKAQAIRAVYEHAAALGSHFAPFSKQSLDIFLPLVCFKYSAEIRGTAAQTLAVVFEAVCSYGEIVGDMNLASGYLPLVAKSIARQIPDEDTADMEVVYALADSLSDTCRMMYLYGLSGALQLTDAKLLVQSCMRSMKACLERRASNSSVLVRSTNGEDERQEILSLLKLEEDLLTPLVDTVGYTLKVFGEDFLSIFQSDVVPVLQPYLCSNDLRACLSAVCLFDDCVEHCGTIAATRFGPPLLEGILHGMKETVKDQDADFQRAAIYGIAQLSRYAPSILQAHAHALVQQLCLMTSVPKQQAPDIAVYENAVSALASLVLFDNAPFRGSGYAKRETVVKSFLAALPLREDEDEAKVCSEGLLLMLESGSIDMHSEGGNVVRVITETLQLVAQGEEIATPTTCERLSLILKTLSDDGPAGQKMVGFANLVSP